MHGMPFSEIVWLERRIWIELTLVFSFWNWVFDLLLTILSKRSVASKRKASDMTYKTITNRVILEASNVEESKHTFRWLLGAGWKSWWCRSTARKSLPGPRRLRGSRWSWLKCEGCFCWLRGTWIPSSISPSQWSLKGKIYQANFLRGRKLTKQVDVPATHVGENRKHDTKQVILVNHVDYGVNEECCADYRPCEWK